MSEKKYDIKKLQEEAKTLEGKKFLEEHPKKEGFFGDGRDSYIDQLIKELGKESDAEYITDGTNHVYSPHEFDALKLLISSHKLPGKRLQIYKGSVFLINDVDMSRGTPTEEEMILAANTPKVKANGLLEFNVVGNS
jgi:hypothetical protein